MTLPEFTLIASFVACLAVIRFGLPVVLTCLGGRAAASIERSQGAIDRALQSSGASEGQTGAIQAGNQLLGIQASQLAEIHALLIAQGRALETERMERLAREERAGEIRRRAFPTETSETLTPARTAF